MAVYLDEDALFTFWQKSEGGKLIDYDYDYDDDYEIDYEHEHEHESAHTW